jgi:hypothetical protein
MTKQLYDTSNKTTRETNFISITYTQKEEKNESVTANKNQLILQY